MFWAPTGHGLIPVLWPKWCWTLGKSLCFPEPPFPQSHREHYEEFVGKLHVTSSLVLGHVPPVPGLALTLPLSQALYITGSTWAPEEMLR